MRKDTKQSSNDSMTCYLCPPLTTEGATLARNIGSILSFPTKDSKKKWRGYL